MSDLRLFITLFLVALLMFILGMLHAKRIMTKKPDGIFYINLSDPEEETMKLQIDIPVEDIPGQSYLIFKIKTTQ